MNAVAERLATASPATATTHKKRIAVIGTGGTFAMHARHRFDWVEYGESGIVKGVDALLQELGELGDVSATAELVPVSFRSLGSTGITPQDWLDLARLIQQTAAQDSSIAGFIITHGTATLEETAWFLELTLALDVPVVLTGAQRPANTEGSDAAANLRSALAVAQTPLVASCGVVVVMDSHIFAAREVSKVASFDLNAFEDPAYGPLGSITPMGEVVLRRIPVRQKALPVIDLTSLERLPRVDIVMSYAGADRLPVDAFVQAGVQGLVSIGLPPGRTANAEAAGFSDAVRQGVVVVQSTRAARGMVPEQKFLRHAGILAGGDLAPQKLRIFLMLALCCSQSPEQIQPWILQS